MEVYTISEIMIVQKKKSYQDKFVGEDDDVDVWPWLSSLLTEWKNVSQM